MKRIQIITCALCFAVLCENCTRKSVKYCDDLNDINNTEGYDTFYYHSGKICTIIKIIDGKLEGVGIDFYENGQVQSIMNFKNGIAGADGSDYTYDKKGRLILYGFWQNRDIEAFCRYDSLGNLIDSNGFNKAPYYLEMPSVDYMPDIKKLIE